MDAVFTVDKHSNVFSLWADSFIHSLAPRFTDSFKKHLGNNWYASDKVIIKYQPPDHQNGSATDSVPSDSLGSAQTGLWQDKQKDCWGRDRSLDSAFLRNLWNGFCLPRRAIISLTSLPPASGAPLVPNVTYIKAPVLAPRIFWFSHLSKPSSHLLSFKAARTPPPPPFPER